MPEESGEGDRGGKGERPEENVAFPVRSARCPMGIRARALAAACLVKTSNDKPSLSEPVRDQAKRDRQDRGAEHEAGVYHPDLCGGSAQGPGEKGHERNPHVGGHVLGERKSAGDKGGCGDGRFLFARGRLGGSFPAAVRLRGRKSPCPRGHLASVLRRGARQEGGSPRVL